LPAALKRVLALARRSAVFANVHDIYDKRQSRPLRSQPLALTLLPNAPKATMYGADYLAEEIGEGSFLHALALCSRGHSPLPADFFR